MYDVAYYYIYIYRKKMKKNFKEKSIDWFKRIGLKYLLNTISTVLMGLLMRYLIKEYLDVDVIKDLFNPITILYGTFISVWSNFSLKVVVEHLVDLFRPNYMMPGGWGGWGGGQGNNGLPSYGSSSNNNLNTNQPTGTPGNANNPSSDPIEDILNKPYDPNKDPLIKTRTKLVENVQEKAGTGLESDNLELPSHIRPADWNRPSAVPEGAKPYEYWVRFGVGEPMDISMPSKEDKKFIYDVLLLTYRAKQNAGTLNPNTGGIKLSESLNTIIMARGGNEYLEDSISFTITKQLRKVFHNEPQYRHFVNEKGMIIWSKIGISPEANIMKYLGGIEPNRRNR